MRDTHDSALTQGVETQFWRSHEIAQACAFVLSFQQAGGPVPAATHWQKRFYDFNVWTAGKRAEKLRYLHAIPTAGFGDLTRTVALEQSPCLPACGAGTGTSQCVGNPQAEDSNTGCVESGSGRVGGRATFRKTREVAHPQLCCAGVSGAPAHFRLMCSLPVIPVKKPESMAAA